MANIGKLMALGGATAAGSRDRALAEALELDFWRGLISPRTPRSAARASTDLQKYD
jgi:hypothetical protein